MGNQTVLEVLSHPFEAFPPPSPQSKAAFETKTSAINVTPSSKLRYDIKEVKEDALWLSAKANVDETAALRIVVEECQSRAAARLLGPLSEEELASIRETVGNNQFLSPVTVALASQGKDAAKIQAEFDMKDSRQERILTMYLSERRHLLKCFELLLSAALNRDSKLQANGKAADETETGLVNLYNVLVDELGEVNDFVEKCFAAMGTFMQRIDSGSGWFQDEERPAVEIEWVQTQLIEATHTLEAVFQAVTKLQEDIPSSRVIIRWLEFLQSHNFLDMFNTVCVFHIS